MKVRAITGIFFIGALVAAVTTGPYTFVPVFSLIAASCVLEFYKMVRLGRTLHVFGSLAALAVSGLSGCILWGWLPMENLLWAVPLVFAVYLIALFRKAPDPVRDVAYTLTGIVYAVLPFSFFMALGFLGGTYNPHVPLGFLVLLWVNDTGAYLAGRGVGRAKLFPRISPNKTWEGLAGGVLLATVASLSFDRHFGVLQKWEWAAVALIIGVFGTAGDLVESMLKRSAKVKDSGNILPGHGGFLDRFDGLLLAAPLVYVFLRLISP